MAFCSDLVLPESVVWAETRRKQAWYVERFYQRHQGHTITQEECQGDTVIICLTCLQDEGKGEADYMLTVN